MTRVRSSTSLHLACLMTYWQVMASTHKLSFFVLLAGAGRCRLSFVFASIPEALLFEACSASPLALMAGMLLLGRPGVCYDSRIRHNELL